MIRKIGTAKRNLTSEGGRRWEAEICLHSGTDPQAPRLMVIFRDPVRELGDRYALLPPDAPKMPERAAEVLSEDDLRRALLRSSPLKTF